MTADLDRFYSQEATADWKAILGEELHYHLGYFRAQESLETGQRQTVQSFYPAIPVGAQVLDAGCGWGGPARMLVAERHCRVQGVTISRAQAAYCRQGGLDVRWLDLERAPLTGSFDVVFMLEALSHIQDKAGLLRRLRPRAARLVLSTSCAADGLPGGAARQTFGGSMDLCTETELYGLVEAAGWRIHEQRNRSFQSLRTMSLWRQRFAAVYGAATPPGHLGVLRRFADQVTRAPLRWHRANPLIDLVAE